MIDLTNSGQEDEIPAPVTTDPIAAMLSEMATYDGEPPLMTLSLLISEVKMWRAKEEYQNKSKLVFAAAISQKLKDHGIELQ